MGQWWWWENVCKFIHSTSDCYYYCGYTILAKGYPHRVCPWTPNAKLSSNGKRLLLCAEQKKKKEKKRNKSYFVVLSFTSASGWEFSGQERILRMGWLSHKWWTSSRGHLVMILKASSKLKPKIWNNGRKLCHSKLIFTIHFVFK